MLLNLILGVIELEKIEIVYIENFRVKLQCYRQNKKLEQVLDYN